MGVEKLLLVCNYVLLGAACSCIFLTLSLRLIPSIVGAFLILLHIMTVAVAIAGCNNAAAATATMMGWYPPAHMVATVFTAIFQGSVSILIFTTTSNFLGALKSYVREDDAAVILKMTGGLCVLMFCLEWFSFFLSYFAIAESQHGQQQKISMNTKYCAKVRDEEEDNKNWPWPFQV